MEQFEQLLTCAICLDRYRNPKLLPCQHSFCMEPCMEGLVDYVRRQVKCPECRAEHRIPYQGVQAFPTNVTLQRFLELHIEISGELPDPTAGQMMERCAVCSEKAYCNLCVHCDKRICDECKSAHMDILRREIARINNQIRRGIHRLQDALAIVEKNAQALKSNCGSVNEEIEEINRRLAKALKDRTEHLRNDIDRYLSSEMKTLDNLKENLEQEIGNIQSNCDLADKHMTEVATAEWDDRELMDAKEIFLRTVEFIRNFEYGDTQDWSRRVRFVMAHDPNQLVLHVAGYGDLNVSHISGSSSQGLLQPPSSQSLGAGLMRSKSDHRLAYRQNLEESGRYGDTGENEPVLGGRRFGERPAARETPRYGRTTTTEYGDYTDPYDDGSSRPTRSRFRSRFARHQDNDSDTEQNTRSGVRFSDHQTPAPKEREKVLDTEDVARGPLSGISRLCDSPRVMKRLQEGIKKKEAPPPPPTYQPPKVTAAPPRRTSQTTPPVTQRQLSEDDEISRIKKANKGATSSTQEPERPVSERVAALKQKSEDRDDRGRGSPTRQRSQTQEVSSEAESDESAPTSLQTRKSTPVTAASRRSSTASDQGTPGSRAKATRSTSSDSTASSSDGSAVRNTGAAFTTQEVKQKILSRTNTPPSTPPTPTTPKTTEKPQFQSRFLPATRPGQTTTTTTASKNDDDEESSTESSSEEETDDSSEEEEVPTTKKENSQTTNKEMAKTDIGPLLARSAQARDSNPKPVEEPTSPRPYTSRFLNKSRSTAVMDEEPSREEEPKYPSGRSRYAALKDRRTRLARSRSTHNLGDDDIDDVIDEPMSPTTQSPSAYLASRGYGRLARTRSSHKLDDPDEDLDEPPVAPLRSKESKSQKTNDPNAYMAAKGYTSSTGTELSRSRSSHALKSRESSPDRPLATTERDGAALSSWARYLKSKYGNRSSGTTGTGSSTGSSGTSGGDTSRRLSLGLSLHGDDHNEPKNTSGSPSPHRTAAPAQVAQQAAQAGIGAGSSPRSQYLQKRRQLYCIGGRGSEPGYFTWPRGVAVAPDNSIVVADSSNHRVQVFDQHGNFLHEFGTYGSGDGEFDCLAGVAVNRIGQYIIADRYNHRVQVFDPSGRFLRAFGSQGSADGRFNYPWGVTTDALGFIYVCDKENHRVQVFQSDGTFVGKFGTCGSKSGQLDHPHYIAVSSTNRVVVSDSNNHRIQIFDVNGRVLSSFGTEGAEEGQFKFPRGVAVDDQGYIFVADSGNNRIQIFHPDGTFLRAFGCWGSGDAEFKGLEGVAMGNNGNIVVCDRENHRIQVF